jgi:integrase
MALARTLVDFAREDNDTARLAIGYRALGFSILCAGDLGHADKLLSDGIALADSVPDSRFAVYGEHPGMVCRSYRAEARGLMGFEWRKDLERREIGRAAENRNPAGATIRHRLAALSSLFEYLCEKNAVSHNPVKGVKRPRAESGEGKTSAIGDHQARELLAAPDEETIKEKRDRAIRHRQQQPLLAETFAKHEQQRAIVVDLRPGQLVDPLENRQPAGSTNRVISPSPRHVFAIPNSASSEG